MVVFLAWEADLTLSYLSSFKTQHTLYLMALEIRPLPHIQHYLLLAPAYLTHTLTDWASCGLAWPAQHTFPLFFFHPHCFLLPSFLGFHLSMVVLTLSRASSLSQAEIPSSCFCLSWDAHRSVPTTSQYSLGRNLHSPRPVSNKSDY